MQAAQCITKLGLQKHYKTRDILLPLILQDKVNLIEAYVFQNHDEQVCCLFFIVQYYIPNIKNQRSRLALVWWPEACIFQQLLDQLASKI